MSDIPWKNVESKETPFVGSEEDVICPGRKLPHRLDGGSGAWEWPAKVAKLLAALCILGPALRDRWDVGNKKR